MMKFIGSVELVLHKDQNRCSVARFLIADEYRFKGFGTETLQRLSEYVFDEMKLKKITLTVFDFNDSAMKCYSKAGFMECSRETRDNGWIAIGMEKLKT
jgi:RimJ/RimL family protein N-acetyltransferase